MCSVDVLMNDTMTLSAGTYAYQPGYVNQEYLHGIGDDSQGQSFTYVVFEPDSIGC